MLFVLRLDDGRCEEHYSLYLLHFVIWVLLFLLILFFPFFTSSEKLWILFSDTVLSTRVVNISPAQKKNQTICFVVSQIKKKSFILIVICRNFVLQQLGLLQLFFFSHKYSGVWRKLNLHLILVIFHLKCAENRHLKPRTMHVYLSWLNI